ncbi:MAG: sulfatase-like hydrolase/transferase [Candidatus Lokiarchaeota archaeon]|nr:sulfatase-like hydrolase/transferase [Candidatus Lokiarchaeota archaeon]
MARDNRPNIVFVFSDQQRADTMGCYGQDLPVTPNLDALAREGVLFEHAFTPQPVCGPARSCLQTGKYATETRCFRNGIALEPGSETIATLLSRGGYEVCYVGKWHLASTHNRAADYDLEPDIDLRTKAVPPERRGGYVDYWVVADVLEATSHGHGGGYMFDKDMKKVTFDKYRVDGVTDFIVDCLNKRDDSKPFFLFCSYIEPHHQNDHKRYEGPEKSKEMFKDHAVPGDLAGTRGDWRENYPDYLGCCWSIDANFVRIRDALAEKGILDNTLIIYASDHGSHFRTRNDEYKRSCHDASIRVPLIIKGPGFAGGMRIPQLVSLIDLPPTILTAAGITPPSYMRGRPLQGLVAGTAKDWPDDVFAQISESQVGRCLRTAKWKYSVSAPGLNGGYNARATYYLEEFLYDLEDDPHERTNRVDDPSLEGVRKGLAGRLARRMLGAGEQAPIILPRSRLALPPERQVVGRIFVDDKGSLSIATFAVQTSIASPIDIPFVDVLEEFMGLRVIVTAGDVDHVGTIQENGGEAVLVDNEGQSRGMKGLLSPILPARVLALHPPRSEAGDAPVLQLFFFTDHEASSTR